MKKIHPYTISKIVTFINQYNWTEIDFPSNKQYWKKCESNNTSIALNIFYLSYNTQEKKSTYLSKQNSARNNKVILLMITDSKK